MNVRTNWWIHIGTFIIVLCLELEHCQIHASCMYESTRYSEGSAVPTQEPCLKCACTRNVLLCYLRVCPQLPDPPPVGCFILHRRRTCCPELICPDLPAGGNQIEARLEPDIPELPYNQSLLGNGCVHNGTLYGTGSAMSTSSLCQYCYCINGKERCVKPKCLLPLDGCTAAYSPHTCCPTHYKCGSQKRLQTTTSTSAAPVDGGCVVSGQRYPDGCKILGLVYSPCDNCYCIRGTVKCVPLSCAPPLLGCTPVVPAGECCAASYNCSGVIEVQPKLNYGNHPVVSKEYAKLRKEVQQKYYFKPKPVAENLFPMESKNPHYIIAQSQTTQPQRLSSKLSTPYYFTSTSEPHQISTAIPTSRQYMATTRHLPVKYETFSPESSNKYSRISLTTTRVNNNEKGNSMRPIFKPLAYRLEATTKLSPVYKHLDGQSKRNVENHGVSTKRHVGTPGPNYSNDIDMDFMEDGSFDGRNNRRIDEQKAESTIDNVTVLPIETSTIPETTDSTLPTETTQFTTETTTEITTTDISTTSFDSTDWSTTETISTTPVELTIAPNSLRPSMNITGTELIGNNTNCIDGSETDPQPEHRIELTELELQESTTEEYSTTLEPEITSTLMPTTTVVSVLEAKTETENMTVTLSPFKKIPSELEAFLNITKSINKKDEDYEYDYNEPSLPPSLPNLKIIPFVAADAVVEEKETRTIPYPTAYPGNPSENIHRTDDPSYGYTLNLFSPPIETEGGFVPRDPPSLNNFYENGYHTTGVVDITSGTSVPAITNPPKTDEDNCIVEGREVRHGELSSEIGACAICICLFGDIVCQPPKCPPLPVGCRRTQPASGNPMCCGQVVCNGDEDSPTVVLDRIDVTSNPQENPTHDPFRDVIRTEPAPNLQSLIGDIMPYLVRQTSTLKPTTHMTSLKPPPLPSTTRESITTDLIPPEIKQEPQDNGGFSFDSVLKLLFSDETETTVAPTPVISTPHASTTASKYQTTAQTTTPQNSWFLQSAKTQTDLVPNRNSIEVPSSVGLLKLAGCNIYGRMYRVGRIISELSGPCLECMCTEIGVQCRPLNC